MLMKFAKKLNQRDQILLAGALVVILIAGLALFKPRGQYSISSTPNAVIKANCYQILTNNLGPKDGVDIDEYIKNNFGEDNAVKIFDNDNELASDSVKVTFPLSVGNINNFFIEGRQNTFLMEVFASTDQTLESCGEYSQVVLKQIKLLQE